MNGLFYLAHLVQTKNDLNRRRRRFWKALPNKKWIGSDANGKYMIGRYVDRVYTKAQAQAGYRKAQQDMKAMTPLITKVRRDIGAKLIWSSHGAIAAIVLDNKRYYEIDIKALAEWHRSEEIILGGNHG